MTTLIKCRKCGGPHVTLRCGKEKTEPLISEPPPQQPYQKFNKPYMNKYDNKGPYENKGPYINKPYENKPYENKGPYVNKGPYINKPYTYNNKSYDNKSYDNKSYGNKSYIDKRKIVTVRISNLPDDITIEELTELVSEWGMIGRVNMSNYECKSGFIDFYNIAEADYFVKALNKTPFDSLILRVEILDKDS